MNTAYVDTRSSGATATAYGGVIDAIGGIAAAVIAIVGLTGFHPELMAGVATIVFGAALLIQGGTLLSEYAVVMSAVPTAADSGGDGGLSVMFLAGAGGIVLGVLALLGIAAAPLTSIAVITFGAALVLSSSSVRHLFVLQSAARRATARSGAEMLAGEMASGSAGVQLLTGLTAIVLGILSVAGARAPVLTLTALLILGVTFIITGSTLSGLVMSFMRQSRPSV
ncbi:MAG TPA: hypothetical protein VHX52_02815 [Steroidobacteraceae bacterium]|jgi:hypothetical protein|nr:hypothetical protein [Steroidobacteraceae bacterium]